MHISKFPDWITLDRSLEPDIAPRLNALTDGISEFTFPGLFLFREHYEYAVSISPDNRLLISGRRPDGTFFLVPEGLPQEDGVLLDLFERFDYLKNLPPSWITAAHERMEPLGVVLLPDRPNFDYLYHADELAQLPGKRFHKKRNHVNAFHKHYNSSVIALKAESEPDARDVLERWRASREDAADYEEALEGLDHRVDFGLEGIVVYVDGFPVGYAMGEPIGQSDTFIVHVEKALPDYRGLYQFLNQAFAERIAERYTLINREQDLGDPGLRQAKMTYRPCGFVEKYRAVPAVRQAFFPEGASESSEYVGCGQS